MNVLGMVLSANALVYTCEQKDKTYALCAVRREDGSELWTQSLPAQPLYNSICIARNGSISVAISDGRIICFGK